MANERPGERPETGLDEHPGGDGPADGPGDVPTRQRPRPAVLRLVAAAVPLVVAAAVGAVLVPADVVPGRPQATRPPVDADNRLGKLCLGERGRLQVRIEFMAAEADDHMAAAAEVLRGDPRVSRVSTETRAEAFVRFKALFEDRPELVERVRVESLPASVEVLPVDHVAPKDLADDLPDEIVGVDRVDAESCLMPSASPEPTR